MIDFDSVTDTLFGEPWKRIVAGAIGATGLVSGGVYVYNLNKHIYQMRSAAESHTIDTLRGRFGNEWSTGESHFDIPETFEPGDNRQYRRQYFDAVRAVSEEDALALPNVPTALADARERADNAGDLTGRRRFIQHRALTACHPTDWNCVPFYREGVEVKVQYHYTTVVWECKSRNTKGECTLSGPGIRHHWDWKSSRAMEHDISGEGAISRLPQARVMYNAMADARNFALTQSDGAELARERDAFKTSIVPSRRLGEAAPAASW
jgi:hypothetical protein